MTDYRELLVQWEASLPVHITAVGMRVVKPGSLTPPPSPYQHGMRWGKWELDAKQLVLMHHQPWHEIDLASCTTSARVLTAIFHALYQPWCAEEDAYCLLRALDVLLHPAAHICVKGIDREFNAARFLREQVERHAARLSKEGTDAQKTDDGGRTHGGDTMEE